MSKALTITSTAPIEAYKHSAVVFLEEGLRKRIRSRVIDIGVTQAHSLVRRRKPNMAGRRLSSIYSRDDAGPAISLKELIATAAALDVDPLEAMFEDIQKKFGTKAVRARRSYADSLRKLRDDVAQHQARGKRARPAAEAPPLLELMGAL